MNERVYGWKLIADELSKLLGTSVSERKVRRFAEPHAPFRLPVRYNAGGTYVLRTDLEAWSRNYDAPHGAHGGLKRPTAA